MAESPDAERVYCRGCGEALRPEAEVCPECGVPQQPDSAGSPDLGSVLDGGNPFVAAALSALVPGLGQIYNRELERGIAFIVASVVAGLSVVLLVGLVLYPAVWVYAIYDAYKRAEEQDR